MYGFPQDRKPPVQEDHEGLQPRFEEHAPGLQVAPDQGEWPQIASPQPQSQATSQQQPQTAIRTPASEGLIPSAIETSQPPPTLTATATNDASSPEIVGAKWDEQRTPPTQTVSPDHEAHEVAGGAGALRTMPPPMVQAKKSRKKLFIIVGAVAAVVIIGAVLGGVLGTQLNKSPGSADSGKNGNTGGDATSDGSSNSPSPTANPAAMTGTSTSVSPYLYPTAISWGSPHLEVFAATSNKARSVYRKYRNSNATTPDLLPAQLSMEVVGGKVDVSLTPFVSVQSRPDASQNHTELLILESPDGSMKLKGHNESMLWSGRNDPDTWQAVGNGVSGASSSPFLIAHAPGNTDAMDLFVLAGGSKLAHMHFASPRWSAATLLSSPSLLPSIPPRAVAYTPHGTSTATSPRADVFVVDSTTRHLLHGTWDSGSWATLNTTSFSHLASLGGFVTSPVTAVVRAPDKLAIFARGGDGRLWMLPSVSTGPSSWTPISPSDDEILAEPDAISWTSTRIDVFAWGKSSNALLHRAIVFPSASSDSGTWTPTEGWEVVARGISGPPKAVSDQEGRMHVFAYGNGTQIVWRTWTAGGGWGGSGVSVLAEVP